MTKTKNPGKQRKNIYTASYHNKRKLLVSPVDKKLYSVIGKKRITVRKGDTVKVMIGEHKGKTGKVEKVDYTKQKVYIKDIKKTNSRGQERYIPFVASNLLITDVVTNDAKRLPKKNTPIKKKVE